MSLSYDGISEEPSRLVVNYPQNMLVAYFVETHIRQTRDGHKNTFTVNEQLLPGPNDPGEFPRKPLVFACDDHDYRSGFVSTIFDKKDLPLEVAKGVRRLLMRMQSTWRAAAPNRRNR